MVGQLRARDGVFLPVLMTAGLQGMNRPPWRRTNGLGMPKILLSGQDSCANLVFIKELQLQGYLVACTTSLEGLAQVIASGDPDLVLIDIDRTPQEGLELLRMIRNQYYNLPVIILFSCDTHRHDPRAMAADFLIHKPVNLDELKGRIIMALEADSSIPLGAAS
jgi:DNA-binding response OmpR family regulator